MNVNVVALSGNLTKDPELRSIPSGTSVCKMRLAVNERRKVGEQWTDVPNYFDVTVWGAQGEACATYLTKGSRVFLQGRLQWREWETPEGGKRQAVDIVAERVQFPPKSENGGGQRFTPESDVPPDTTDLGAVGGSPLSADIPFARPRFPEWGRERVTGARFVARRQWDA